MKKLIVLGCLLFSTSVFAEQVFILKSKCTVMGNLKVKVAGLDMGKIGNGYLEADLPYFEDCDDIQRILLQNVGRGAVEADADLKVNKFYEPYNGRKYRCKIWEVRQLTLAFKAYHQLKFRKRMDRVLGYSRNPCKK